MKIQILATINKINITYEGPIKTKNKTFKGGDYEGVLNFAMTCPDRFIFSCSNIIKEWAIKTDHDILKCKSWVFC